MPIYVYRPDDGSDEEIERFFHANPPEKVAHEGRLWSRSPITRMAVVGLKPAPEMGDSVLRGYYEQECVKGSRFRTRLPADTIKRVWRDDRTTADERAADAGDEGARLRLSKTKVPA